MAGYRILKQTPTPTLGSPSYPHDLTSTLQCGDLTGEFLDMDRYLGR